MKRNGTLIHARTRDNLDNMVLSQAAGHRKQCLAQSHGQALFRTGRSTETEAGSQLLGAGRREVWREAANGHSFLLGVLNKF